MQVINSNSEDCHPEGGYHAGPCCFWRSCVIKKSRHFFHCHHIRQTIHSSYTRQANESWLNHKNVPQYPKTIKMEKTLLMDYHVFSVYNDVDISKGRIFPLFTHCLFDVTGARMKLELGIRLTWIWGQCLYGWRWGCTPWGCTPCEWYIVWRGSV